MRMTRRMMVGLAVLIMLFASEALAQAAAESALGNSAAGTAAAKTGSALGNALNKAFDKTGQKLQNAAQAPAQQNATTPAQATAPGAEPANSATPQPVPPADASLVQFSVQEVGKSCPPAKDWKKPESQAAADDSLTVCSLHASAKPFPKTKYKPVVDIKF